MNEMVNYVQEMGGSLRQTVNTETGEVIYMRESIAQNSRACAGGLPVKGGTAQAQKKRRALSTCHNSPQIEYRKGASTLTVKRKKELKQESAEEQQREKRGKVAGFSQKSRMRLMRTLGSIKRSNLPLFVTLTFPKDYPDIKNAKRLLDNFLKRLARNFPDVAGVWKLEPQKRGAPHFHLLVWGVPYAELLAFTPWAWCEVVGSDDPNHLAWHIGALGNKPCVQRIEKQRGVFWYASKYMSKEVKETYSDWGRWWGVFHRENLPVGELVNEEVSEEKAIEFIRYMRRYAHIKSRDYKSLTIICDSDIWINRLL